MSNVMEMLKGQLDKMTTDGSIWAGLAGGFMSFTIPAWVTAKQLSLEHGVLMVILLAVFVMEWLIGHRLAKTSPVQQKVSNVMIDSAIRDFVIVIICMIAYGFDYLIGSGSVIFCLFTCAFIYHNFYSLLANIVVLGWGDKFPLWLLIWLQDEIDAKRDKYFRPKEKTMIADVDDQENNVR